ncbi:hypothetical protein [Mucilaginibacter sp. CSA2-8R]|uniref:hypothetical protein n=1 Tax=Mucilaginibacter sp. CSA2-8R TaxID=3141542 RepID=UPI00315DA18D
MTVVNKLDKTISVDYQNSPTPALEGNLVVFYTGDDQQIQPDSAKAISKNGGKNAWHDFIEDGKTKVLYIYVFDTDSLQTYEERLPIAVLINQHKYIKQLRFTEDALKKAGWKITITP